MHRGNTKSIGKQVRRNAVALISLVVALWGLGYNTWRNEVSELNRNHRQAAFEILSKLNQLQQVIFHRHYDMDEIDRGNPRLGWSIVLNINDLAQLLDPPMPQQADQLRQTWGENWEGLGEDQVSVDAILETVDSVRDDTLILLHSLE